MTKKFVGLVIMLACLAIVVSSDDGIAGSIPQAKVQTPTVHIAPVTPTGSKIGTVKGKSKVTPQGPNLLQAATVGTPLASETLSLRRSRNPEVNSHRDEH
jgi:hypothetical protein